MNMDLLTEAVSKADGKDDRAAFLIAYPVPAGFRFPDGFKVKRFRGLAYCQLITRDDGERRLVAMWATKSVYEARARVLEEALGLRAAEWCGYQSGARFKRIPIWKRIAVYTVIMFIPAVGGAVIAVANYFDDLFKPPRFSVHTDTPPDGVKMLPNSPVTVPLTVTNNTLSVHTPLWAQLKGEDDEKLKDVPTTGPLVKCLKECTKPLTMGDTDTLKVSVRHATATSGVLKIWVKGRAGLFRGWKMSSVDVPFEVWEERAIRKGDCVIKSENGAVMLGQMVFGERVGTSVTCDAVISGPDDLSFDGVGPSEVAKSVVQEVPVHINWLVGPQREFTTLHFWIAIRGENPRTSEEWDRIFRDNITLEIDGGT